MIRRVTASKIEGALLGMGFDVRAAVIAEDDTKLIIYGPAVNRVFAYNLLRRPDFRKLLHSEKYTEITFADSMDWPRYFETYPVH